MADCFEPEKRSEVMSRIRSTGTSPEKRAEQLLKRWLPNHLIFVHPKEVFGRPDFLVPGLDLAIFVDGCFFHGCPKHYREPKGNVDYWRKKLRANKRRDREVNRALKQEGFVVLRIWEHEMKGKGPIGRERFRRRIRRIQNIREARQPDAQLGVAEEPAAYLTHAPLAAKPGQTC